MTQNILSNLEIKSFEKEVHREYQKMESELKECVRYRTISGHSTQFPKLGTLGATERIVATPVVLNNQSAGSVTIDVTKWSVAQMTDIFLQSEVNFDAKQESAIAVAAGAHRKMTQIIIDAFEAQKILGYTNLVDVNVGGNNTSLNVPKYAEAAKKLDVNSVPTTDRYSLIHVNAHHSLTQETNVSSSDYNSKRVLETGRIAGYYGFANKVIGNLSEENGMYKTGNERFNYFFHKSAMGLVMNKQLSVDITYENLYTSHLIVATFSAGAKVIDETGIVQVSTYEA